MAGLQGSQGQTRIAVATDCNGGAGGFPALSHVLMQ